MPRSLHYLRLFPGTEARFDQMLTDVPAEVVAEVHASGLRDVSIFRRGTDVWRYAVAEPGREAAYGRFEDQPSVRAWRYELRGVIAEAEAPDGGLIWFDEVFHTDAPGPDGPWERGFFTMVIDTEHAELYDRLHAEPWPEMLQAIAEAGYRDYTGFRRGAHVVYYGRYYPDFQTVIDRINATDVAARWGQALGGAITTFTDADGGNLTAHEVFHLD